MRRRTIGATLMVGALVGAIVGVLGTGSATGQETTTVDPTYVYEGWFNRAQPNQVIVPTPQGDISPGNQGVTVQAQEGDYPVSSRGGQEGDDSTEGDQTWIAFQWDTLSIFDATADEFIATFTHSPTKRGDFGPAVLQACNILVGWAASDGSNPWNDRPTVDCSNSVQPTVDGTKYTFDLTRFASTWLDGTGFGVVIKPGSRDQVVQQAFQITFAGYDHPNPAVRPAVKFTYTSEGTTDFTTPTFAPPGGDFGGGFDSGFDSGGDFGPTPGIDPIPDDVGSEPVADDIGGGDDPVLAAPPQPISSNTPGFAWWLVVLVAGLGGAAFWATGTALGPLGEPAVVRRGRLDELLAERVNRS